MQFSWVGARKAEHGPGRPGGGGGGRPMKMNCTVQHIIAWCSIISQDVPSGSAAPVEGFVLRYCNAYPTDGNAEIPCTLKGQASIRMLREALEVGLHPSKEVCGAWDVDFIQSKLNRKYCEIIRNLFCNTYPHGFWFSLYGRWQAAMQCNMVVEGLLRFRRLGKLIMRRVLVLLFLMCMVCLRMSFLCTPCYALFHVPVSCLSSQTFTLVHVLSPDEATPTILYRCPSAFVCDSAACPTSFPQGAAFAAKMVEHKQIANNIN